MKMQTVRNILMPQEQAVEVSETAVRALLPPMTSMGLPMASPPREEKPKVKDLAERRAGEMYLTMMAGMGFRTQLK
ncbi:hypothetical protein ABS71_04080 [bacterium SCN 62-11]|nr:hypothetical protein [Candidatus Eremiobacteraeota bacterium]ODT75778.1 MAG: hypothetical protein ABS71_04080 [bacterium SCN 62-11]